MTQEEINSLKVNDTIRALDEDGSGNWVECKVINTSYDLKFQNEGHVYFEDETGNCIGTKWNVSKEELLDDDLYLKP